ncbi:amino acid permease [Thermoflavimicrobium daqui]|jgi:L-asparagine transporter-like permease|uniref:Amino acid permease n=1 Tax=Thermoflavimicrobium daqui TaxID=2137476 RepID=A0A364K1F2_9BACL|nr:amino acid permease [Thermoflavimicrobium daqui]RAL21859.1 amino acid permease [Thermoflavimicrobium daqui]
MAEKQIANSEQNQNSVFERENVLERKLGTKQLSMVVIGTAVGTGLFMGSGLSISYAGPSVILSYAVAALIAFFMMMCLAEMTVKHPTAGSFGTHAEYYLGPWSGFMVRTTYWIANVIAVGGEVTAVALYMHYWLPSIPKWVWVILFSIIIIFLNARSVSNFGTMEYWFSIIKITAIIGFILIGAAVLFGIGTKPVGFSNYVAHGGFMPNGWYGLWLGTTTAMFSYIGSEMIAVTAGESKNPSESIPKSMRLSAFRLIIFYVLSLAIMVAVIPWNQAGSQEITQSPFVKVFAALGIPLADHIMNFVVLVAALSAMNAQVYASTRMVFSLAKGNYVPKALGKLSERGVPINALLISSIGLVLATVLNVAVPDAYSILIGLATIGALVSWFMIFMTYFRFKKQNQEKLSYHAPLYPVIPIVGTLLLGGTIVTLGIDPNWRFTWYAGAGWLALISIIYLVWIKKKKQ